MYPLKKFFAHTHQGPFLNVNEDDIDVDLIHNLAIIFDGLGGAGLGDRCVAEIKQIIKNYFTKNGTDPNATFPFFCGPKYLLEGNAIINAMKYAHSKIFKNNRDLPMDKRAGASAICAYIKGPILTFVSTGNCISLLLRNGILETINYPDSLDMMSVDEFNKHSFTSPMSGFGLFEDLSINVREVKLFPDDLIIMLTDGIYSRITKKELRYAAQKKTDQLENLAQELISLANSRDNLDNQSIILLRF